MLFKDLNLNKPLIQALDEKGFDAPTSIQEKSFSTIMSGKDIVGLAQTGTGKTIAYLLPLLRLWKFVKDPYPRIVIVVPTRELVVQVVEEAQSLGKYLNIEVDGAYGGANIKPQIHRLTGGLDILVATPGRLLDLIYKGALKAKMVKKLVIDEVDEMLNLGFRHQLKTVLDLLPEKKQTLMFSATLSEDVNAFIQDYFIDPILIETASVGTPVDQVEQVCIHVPNYYTKVNYLLHFLAEKEWDKVLVFAKSKAMADLLFDQLEDSYQDEIGIIHSNKSQNFRFRTFEGYQNGSIKILIATDIVARGIDIQGVTHVVHFDVPDAIEDYIHRTGRTARMEDDGKSILLVSKFEFEKFEELFGPVSFEIKEENLPENVEISDRLIDDEKPMVSNKAIKLKLPKIKKGGGAFHPKKRIASIKNKGNKKFIANKSKRKKK